MELELESLAGFLLDASSPRDAALKILGWIQKHNRARSVALWREEEGELLMEISVAADEDTISGARTLWAGGRAALKAGGPLSGESQVLAPTKQAGVYVYLDGVTPKRVDLKTTVEGAGIAALALRRLRPGASRREMDDDLKREELIATLNLHEWNIARTARARSVTRKTIYDWMAKHKIARERVSKS